MANPCLLSGMRSLSTGPPSFHSGLLRWIKAAFLKSSLRWIEEYPTTSQGPLCLALISLSYMIILLPTRATPDPTWGLFIRIYFPFFRGLAGRISYMIPSYPRGDMLLSGYPADLNAMLCSHWWSSFTFHLTLMPCLNWWGRGVGRVFTVIWFPPPGSRRWRVECIPSPYPKSSLPIWYVPSLSSDRAHLRIKSLSILKRVTWLSPSTYIYKSKALPF